MKQVDSEDGQIVVEVSRREMETLYCCVVEAMEALREDEFRIRVGVEYDAGQHLIDGMRTVLGWPSIEDLRGRLEPRFGRDGHGAAAPVEPLPPAVGRRHIRQWSDDEAVLAEIGAALVAQIARVEVSIPSELALAAVAAWDRDDVGDPAPEESAEERTTRQRAGSLALIGLAISDHGRATTTSVVVGLDPWLAGEAIRAADERNLKEAESPNT